MTKGERTREKIFEVAVKEFAEHGYEGARVASIAELAGVNKERLYANFGSKDGLFAEVWKRTYALIIEEDRGFLSIDERNLADMGRIVLSSYMRFHERHPEFWKIFAWENLMKGKHNALIRGLKKPVHAHLERLYRLGQERGIFKPTVSFPTYMFVLISISFTFASNKATMSETFGLDFHSPRIAEPFLEECCLLISRGPGAE